MQTDYHGHVGVSNASFIVQCALLLHRGLHGGASMNTSTPLPSPPDQDRTLGWAMLSFVIVLGIALTAAATRWRYFFPAASRRGLQESYVPMISDDAAVHDAQ